jgi:hypothetical protein
MLPPFGEGGSFTARSPPGWAGDAPVTLGGAEVRALRKELRETVERARREKEMRDVATAEVKLARAEATAQLPAERGQPHQQVVADGQQPAFHLEQLDRLDSNVPHAPIFVVEE